MGGEGVEPEYSQVSYRYGSDFAHRNTDSIGRIGFVKDVGLQKGSIPLGIHIPGTNKHCVKDVARTKISRLAGAATAFSGIFGAPLFRVAMIDYGRREDVR